MVRVFAAWRSSPEMHLLREPASEADIAGAERAMGRPLPSHLRSLYEFSNGMEPLHGNLLIEQLIGDEGRGLVGMGDRLRSWGWLIPDELLMFGGDGSDEFLGLWYPPHAAPNGPTPVVMVGETLKPACLALVGTGFPAFLRAWSAYYLLVGEAPEAALDALGIPDHLRVLDEDAGIAPYFAWADPDLPDTDPDPYRRGMDGATLASLIRSH